MNAPMLGYRDDEGHWHAQRDYVCAANGDRALCRECHAPGIHRVEMRVLAAAPVPRCPEHGLMVSA